jgi:hypothetical protein
MIVACLVPFTNTRQAAASFSLSGPPVAESETSTGRQGQEDETEREEEQEISGEKSQDPQRRFDRLPSTAVCQSYPIRIPSLRVAPRSDTPPIDPFRNGLGSPYRC